MVTKMLQELLDRTLRMSVELMVISYVNAQQKAYTMHIAVPNQINSVTRSVGVSHYARPMNKTVVAETACV